MNFKIDKNELFSFWNTERILISETPKIVSDKSKYFKYREFGESNVLVWDTKSNITSN